MKNFKKVLGIFLGLAMCGTLASCGSKYDVEAAKDNLFQLYKNTTSTTASYDLVCQVQIGEDVYPVTWDLTVAEGGDASCIELGQPADGKVTVNITRDFTTPTVDTEYTLHYVVTDPKGKNGQEGTFTRKVPVFEYATFATIKAACDAAGSGSTTEATFDFRGIVTCKSSYTKTDDTSGTINYLYVENDTGAMCCYNVKTNEEQYNAAKLGAEVVVSGQATLYQGTYEFQSGCTFEITQAAPETYTATFLDFNQIFTTAANLKDGLVNYQNRLVKLTGVTLGNVGSNNYQYFTFGGKESYFRASDSSNYLCREGGQTYYDYFLADWVKGYTADIAGILCCFSGNHYIMPVETTEAYYKVTSRELSPELKVNSTIEEFQAKFALEYAGSAEIELPTAGTIHTDVALTYALKAKEEPAPEGVVYADVKIEEGKLIVNGEVEGTATLLVTATLGEATKTEEIPFAVTLPKPITIAEFVANADTENKAYIQGTVVAVNATGKAAKFVLSDGTGVLFSNDTQLVEVGDVVLMSGKFNNYYGAAQIANGTLLKTVSKGNTETGRFTAMTAADLKAIADGYTSLDSAGKEARVKTVFGKAYKFTAYIALDGSYLNAYEDAAHTTKICETTFTTAQSDAIKLLFTAEGSVQLDIYCYCKGTSSKGIPQVFVRDYKTPGAEYTEVPFNVNSFITGAALGLIGSYADGDAENPAQIGKCKWTFFQTADYGDGIQMRTNAKGDSKIWNVTPMVEDITKVHFVWTNTGKTISAKTGIIEVTFSTTADFAEGTTQSVLLNTTTTEYEYDVACTLAGARYVRILHTTVSGALYWESIEVCC